MAKVKAKVKVILGKTHNTRNNQNRLYGKMGELAIMAVQNVVFFVIHVFILRWDICPIADKQPDDNTCLKIIFCPQGSVELGGY